MARKNLNYSVGDRVLARRCSGGPRRKCRCNSVEVSVKPFQSKQRKIKHSKAVYVR